MSSLENLELSLTFDSNFETECKLFIQNLVLDNDCCISRNVGKTKINLVTSNSLYFLFIKKLL